MRAAQAAEEAEAALAHADALAARAQAAAQDAALMGVAIGHGGFTNELLEHFVMKLDMLVQHYVLRHDNQAYEELKGANDRRRYEGYSTMLTIATEACSPSL
jgi:hypothetical protein